MDSTQTPYLHQFIIVLLPPTGENLFSFSPPGPTQLLTCPSDCCFLTYLMGLRSVVKWLTTPARQSDSVLARKDIIFMIEELRGERHWWFGDSASKAAVAESTQQTTSCQRVQERVVCPFRSTPLICKNVVTGETREALASKKCLSLCNYEQLVGYNVASTFSNSQPETSAILSVFIQQRLFDIYCLYRIYA